MNLILSFWKAYFRSLCPVFYGGSPQAPSQPTNTSQTVSTIPDWLQPNVQTMLGAANQQIYQTNSSGQVTGLQPYQPYSSNPSNYVAGFSPLQTQSFQGAQGLTTPGQFQSATNTALNAGLGGLNAANNAVGLGQAALNTGAAYGQEATNANDINAYMNPYAQDVINQQNYYTNQQYDLTGQQEQGAATSAGAFGGTREAMMGALNNQYRNQQLATNEATGLNTAFNNAQQQMLNANNQQLAGISGAVNAGQYGLAGIGAMNSSAGTLGNLGSQQLSAQQSNLGLQNSYGQQQQANQQQIINQAVQNYGNAQQYPYMQLGYMSDLLRGLPTGNTTQTQYIAQPTALSQGLGLAASGLGAYMGMSGHAGGGVVQSYAKGGIASYSAGGEAESRLYNMPVSEIKEELQRTTSPTIKQLATRILAEKSMGQSGIASFAEGGTGRSMADQLRDLLEGQKASQYQEFGDTGWTPEDIANYQSTGKIPVNPNNLPTIYQGQGIPGYTDSMISKQVDAALQATRSPASDVINIPPYSEPSPGGTAPPSYGNMTPYGSTGATAQGNPYHTGTISGEYIPGQPASNAGIASAALPNNSDIPGQSFTHPNATPNADMEAARAQFAEQPRRSLGPDAQKWLDMQNAQQGATSPLPEPIPATPPIDPMEAPPSVWPGIKSAVGKGMKYMGGIGAIAGIAEKASEQSNLDKYVAERAKAGDPAAQNIMASGGPDPIMESLKEPVRKVLEKLSPEAAYQHIKDDLSLGNLSDYAKYAQSRLGLGQTAPSEQQQPPATPPTPPPAQAQPTQQATGQTPANQGQGLSAVAQTPPVSQGIGAPGNPAIGQPPVSQGIPAPQPQAQSQVEKDAEAMFGSAKKEADKSLEQIDAERTALLKAHGLDGNKAAQDYLSKIINERGNSEADARRQAGLRLMEFGAHWATTPGNALVAGMTALKQTMPAYIEDQAKRKEMNNHLDEVIYKLQDAQRQEGIGNIDKAVAAKQRAQEFFMKAAQPMVDLQKTKMTNDAHLQATAMSANATLGAARINASARAVGTAFKPMTENQIHVAKNNAMKQAWQVVNKDNTLQYKPMEEKTAAATALATKFYNASLAQGQPVQQTESAQSPNVIQYDSAGNRVK